MEMGAVHCGVHILRAASLWSTVTFTMASMSPRAAYTIHSDIHLLFILCLRVCLLQNCTRIQQSLQLHTYNTGLKSCLLAEHFMQSVFSLVGAG